MFAFSMFFFFKRQFNFGCLFYDFFYCVLAYRVGLHEINNSPQTIIIMWIGMRGSSLASHDATRLALWKASWLMTKAHYIW